jgi:hypothetical protein
MKTSGVVFAELLDQRALADAGSLTTSTIRLS